MGNCMWGEKRNTQMGFCFSEKHSWWPSCFTSVVVVKCIYHPSPVVPKDSNLGKKNPQINILVGFPSCKQLKRACSPGKTYRKPSSWMCTMKNIACTRNDDIAKPCCWWRTCLYFQIHLLFQNVCVLFSLMSETNPNLVKNQFKDICLFNQLLALRDLTLAMWI